MRADFRAHPDSVRLRNADHLHGALCRNVAQMEVRACLGCQHQIPGSNDILCRIRDTRKLQPDCVRIVIDHASVHKIPVFAMCADRNVQLRRHTKCLQRDQGVHDALPVLGDRGGSGIHHAADIRQFFSLLSFRDSADLHNMNRRKCSCLKPHIIHLVRRIDDRPCVRHRADRRIASARCRLRAGPDILLVGETRIAQMHMQVNQSRHDPAAGRIDLHRFIR